MGWLVFWTCLWAVLPLCRCLLLSSCNSEIYCTGEILRMVQVTKLFDDDKYFVDMKLKVPPDIVLAAFQNLTTLSPDKNLTELQLRKFVESFFEAPGMEFEPWTPPDWHEKPLFLSKIVDLELRSWAEKLHHLWKSLGRKLRDDVRDHPELYSQIYTPYPVIVPGGRFRELYYWDSYWVINGLLLSEMTVTAKGMIQNFLYLVDRYGFVPNGARVYYERRSQPPFLTLMVESYYQATQDEQFLRAALPVLEKEYEYWMGNRSLPIEVGGIQHYLNVYRVPVDKPRPESYSDDLELAEGLPEGDRASLYMELNSGAESGWDFSSRWFVDSQGANAGNLRDIHTSDIIPADLNALLCRNERTLARFHRALGNSSAAERFDQALQLRLQAVEAVLWEPGKQIWLDYNFKTKNHHPAFYPTNLAPLWAGCYSQSTMGEKALQYLEASGALQYPNGVPTSLTDSGQQWDLPNAWPPLQHMLIEGLSNLKSTRAQETAIDLSQKWIRTNWLAYHKYDAMFEKYDVNGDGKPGGGGEYEVQLGFGWTNGVALQLLDQFGDRLTSESARLNAGLVLWLLCSTILILF